MHGSAYPGYAGCVPSQGSLGSRSPGAFRSPRRRRRWCRDGARAGPGAAERGGDTFPGGRLRPVRGGRRRTGASSATSALARPPRAARLRLDRPPRAVRARSSPVGEVFGLHPLAVEDAVHAHQRPSWSGLATTACSPSSRPSATSSTPNSPPRARSSRPARSWSSPASASSSPSATAARLAARRAPPPGGRPRAARQGPLRVLHAIADHVVDDYLAVTDAIAGRHRRGRDRRLLGRPSAIRPSGSTSSSARCWSSSARCPRSCGPCRLSSGRCGRRPAHPEVLPRRRRPPRPRPRAGRRLRRPAQLHPPGQPRAGHDAQNEDMRKITAWAAIIAVPTMVSGVYGMNFEAHARAPLALRLSTGRGRGAAHLRGPLSQVQAHRLALSIVKGSTEDIDSLEPLWVAVHHAHAASMPELAPYVSDAETWAREPDL